MHMQTATRVLSTAVALALLVGATPLVAQAPQPVPGVTQEAQPLSAKGELVRVSAERQLLWIKTADDKELQFQFTDDTEIVGANERVEGLATMAGAQVTVQYRAENRVAIATRIEVQPDAQSDMPLNQEQK